jgi:hypothetical protein
MEKSVTILGLTPSRIMKSGLVLAVLGLLISVIGCNRNQTRPNQNGPHITKAYAEADLANLIKPGMSMADITNEFGHPGGEISLSDEAQLFTYMFPLQTRNPGEGPHLTGFSVDIKNGHVISWSPITGMTGGAIQPGSSQGSFGEQLFELFIVNDNLTNIVNAVESKGSVDMSDLNIAPDFGFGATVFAGDSTSGRPGEKSVILVMANQDVPMLKKLTENNFGKRFLIVCRHKVIAAPVISGPVASSQLLFTVQNGKVLDELRK